MVSTFPGVCCEAVESATGYLGPAAEQRVPDHFDD